MKSVADEHKWLSKEQDPKQMGPRCWSTDLEYDTLF